VVYNHLGPEGNYLGEYGPYFTDRYKTPWGAAVNFDGPHSDEVRRFFLENALMWQTEFHADALRVDAVHAIRDFSAQPFLEELVALTERQAVRLNRRFYLIAESDLNDTRIIRPRELGGYGFHAQWSDDFHHALHALLTGERDGYYCDFGQIAHLAKAFREGYTYTGQYSPYRQRRFGNSPRQRPAHQFIVCSANHDQIGNRMLGDRPGRTLSFDAQKVAAAAVILSPYLPLVFMGEEYGEPAPFQYFISHGDPNLVEAVRRGRREEFAEFAWKGEVPDPQDEATFLRCKLRHELRHEGHHRVLWEFSRELIRLRRTLPALSHLSKESQEVIGFEKDKVLFVRRWFGEDGVFLLLHFGDRPASLALPLPPGDWHKELDSADKRWLGSGQTLPERLHSEEEVTLTVGPRAAILYSGPSGWG
jgi:maltooligosyltrehalose trehalohydrolase